MGEILRLRTSQRTTLASEGPARPSAGRSVRRGSIYASATLRVSLLAAWRETGNGGWAIHRPAKAGSFLAGPSAEGAHGCPSQGDLNQHRLHRRWLDHPVQ